MFMMFIEFPTPLNSICKKCFGKSEMPAKIFTSKPSLKNIRNDLHANDIMICDKPLQPKILRMIKCQDEVQVEISLKDAEG